VILSIGQAFRIFAMSVAISISTLFSLDRFSIVVFFVIIGLVTVVIVVVIIGGGGGGGGHVE
jgi:hypothetical protein